MRNSTMLMVVLSLSLAACATDNDVPDGDALPGPTVHKIMCKDGCSADVDSALQDGDWILVRNGTYQRADTLVDSGKDECVPAAPAQGACAFACEPDQFVETIPLGTCAAAHCQMRDGGEVIVGGCHR